MTEVSSYLLASAKRIAHDVKEGKVSAREVLERHIARIREVNRAINAVVEERFDVARSEADEADARVTEGQPLPELHGVPCTVKEFFALPGMRQTGGLVSRRDFVPDEEATGVARLRRAGAIVMATTNVSELGMWMETSNKVYGRTNNPYDPKRTAGGSSGGEGAIVGAGASPFGLGSDIGGSIRMPAFFNGVFGHKPTGGLVPGTGQFPLAENAALRYLCTGPLARRAQDLMPLLRILAGPDGRDAGTRELVLGDPDDVQIAGLTVADVRGNGFLPVSSGLKDAQARAANALSHAGANVRRESVDSLKRSLEMWAALMGDAADTSFAELLGDGTKVRVAREWGRMALRRSHHTFPALALATLERGSHLLPRRMQRAAEEGRKIADELEGLIGDGVMLYPSHTSVAPKHHRSLLIPVNWVYTAIFNIAEMPVTQVPLGLDARGLPLGIQVAAARGNDHVCIAVAQELERSFGGWRPPPGAFSSGGLRTSSPRRDTRPRSSSS